MTIDKILSKNFKENPMIHYDIFINNIFPFINNLYLNNNEKNKRIIEIFKNDMKKYIIETFGKNYHKAVFYDEILPKKYVYIGIGFFNNIEEMFNSLDIGLQSKNTKINIDDIIYNEDEISNYHFNIKIWLYNSNLIKNNLKCIKNYFKKKLNNNFKLLYFNIDKIQESYFGADKIECHFKINYTFDKINNDWTQFKKILIEKKNKENNILKNIFLNKILNIFE
jgi:hypothetical protein